MLASPVPTHNEPSAGLISTAPIDSVGASSSSGRQFAPPSVVFHTPPSAVPAYSAPAVPVSAVTRPLTTPQPAPEFDHTGSR